MAAAAANRFIRSRLHGVLIYGALLTSISTTEMQAAATSIYRCETADGPVLYSQFDCPQTHLQAGVALEPHSFVEMPALSPSEQAALTALHRTLDRNRVVRAKTRHRARQQWRQEQQNRARACRAARSELARLREEKRRGYSAAEARSLDRRYRELSASKKENC